MTDPIYQYVKGEGWVLQRFDVRYINHSNRRFILENRKPILGEYFFTTWDGHHDMNEFAQNITKGQFLPQDYANWSPRYEKETTKEVEKGWIYVLREIT